MKKDQTGAILIISLLIMLAITGIGIATFSIIDTNTKITSNSSEFYTLVNLANAVLDHGSQVLDKENKNLLAAQPGRIPTTCSANKSCQYWTYGQVPNTIMDNNIHDIVWWNSMSSSNNIFPATGIPSQYKIQYIIEAQPFDVTNNLSTYKIIAFVYNSTTGQSVTRQKMYFAKNLALVTAALNAITATVNDDGAPYAVGSGTTSTCGAYTAYNAADLNIPSLFNVKNGDIIYIDIVWNKANSTSSGQSIWAEPACGSVTIQGAKYLPYMPAMIGYAKWNGKQLDTGTFDDNPATTELDHFKSVDLKYTVQATLLKDDFTYWFPSVGATIPTTARWLFPAMRSLWVNPQFSAYSVAGNGMSEVASQTYCQTVNGNLRATWATVTNRYTLAGFEYPYWGWLSKTSSICAAYTTYPTAYPGEITPVPDAQLACTSDPNWSTWTPASQLMSVWCDGAGQDIYLKTQTGTINQDRRWPIKSWYPKDQEATKYRIKVQFATAIPW